MNEKKENFRNLLCGPIADPIKELKKFIGVFWGSDLDDESIKQLMCQILLGQGVLIYRGVKSAKIVFEETKYDEELVKLVLWEANIHIEEPLVEQAKAWLKQQIVFTEAVIKECDGTNSRL